MNTFFNLKRFLSLVQCKRQETCKQLLWAGIITFGICMLCILYDINRGGVYYAEHTEGSELLYYTLLMICIAPVLLETNLSKRNSIIELLTPASTFEKYFHFWLKYIILLPIPCLIMLMCLKGVLSFAGFSYLQRFANAISLSGIDKNQLMICSLVQGICFIGHFGFRKHPLLKSSLLFFSCIVVILLGIIFPLMLTLPDERQNYDMNHIITNTNYNFPVSPFTEFFIALCGYLSYGIFLLGAWVSGYFLYKEKQL